MPNKKISFKEKEIVKQKLAKGVSYRKAMEGTQIASTRTVGKIANDSHQEIQEIRENYLELIEKFNAGLIDRAKLWAEMTKATKPLGKKKVPDWTARKEALVYIDRLSGIDKDAPDTSIEIKLSAELEELAT